MWNANSLIQDLNSSHYVHFQWQWPLIHSDPSQIKKLYWYLYSLFVILVRNWTLRRWAFKKVKREVITASKKNKEWITKIVSVHRVYTESNVINKTVLHVLEWPAPAQDNLWQPNKSDFYLKSYPIDQVSAFN